MINIEESFKFNVNDTIIIGCSSGPDSMALTYVLLELRKKIGFKIICAHVNHNVRIESKEEEKFLESYCEKNNIFYERMIIEKYGDDNFHNEARTIRYNFFEKILHFSIIYSKKPLNTYEFKGLSTQKELIEL